MGKNGIGMAVSGGGFRATLFHLGAFWWMNDMGYLKKVDRICSVSGGSITAAMLGLKWKKLKFDENGVAPNFIEEVAKPLQHFCSQKVDVPAVLGGWLSIFKSPGDIITKHYNRLFNSATLFDLPKDDEGPRFIIYATNLQTGVSFRFSRPYMGDYIIGLSDEPIPNENQSGHRYSEYLASIDEIEKATGLDFLSALSADEQREIESEPADRAW